MGPGSLGFTSGKRPRSHDDAAAQAEPEFVGRTLGGKYVVETLLGGGSMGAVYRGRQLPLGNAIAIKVMRAEFAADPSFGERFFREAKAATLFDHPGAVRVIDFGEEPDGLAYIVTELVEGRDLATVMREEWPLQDERVVSIVLQILGVLGKAHDAGLVHRDIKPENVLLVPDLNDDGDTVDRVKVCDFGIAKLLEGAGVAAPTSGSLTAHGFVVGTPEYMSPEQAQGKAVDGRSDLYSVGVLLFHMLTRQMPFPYETALQVVIAHVTETPVAPSRRRPEVDPRFDEVVLKALSKDPAERYQSARGMRRAIRVAFAPPENMLGAGSYGEIPQPVFSSRTPHGPTIRVTIPPLSAGPASAPVNAYGETIANPKTASTIPLIVRVEPRRGVAWLLVVLLLVLLAAGAAWFFLVRHHHLRHADVGQSIPWCASGSFSPSAFSPLARVPWVSLAKPSRTVHP